MKNKKKQTEKSSRFATFGIGKEKDTFFENLAMLLASGMNVIAAVDALEEDVRSRKLKKILRTLRNDVEAGTALWKALTNTGLVPDNATTLIKIGEESGRLIENLQVVVIQQEKERSFKSRLRSAMFYPLFVLILALVVGVGIAWFILPRLTGIFSQLDVELPFFTRALIWFGNFLGEHGAIAIPLFIVFITFIMYFIFIFKKTKVIGEKILFSLPVIKRLVQEVELARFGYILGMLLEAGLPVVQAVHSLSGATNFHSYKKLYKSLEVSVAEGNSFQKSLAQYKNTKKLIPISIQRLMSNAERSGNLSETLLKIGKKYDEKIETTTKNLTVLLEPLLLVLVWLGVVFIALAVILPIYSLIGGLNDGTTAS